MDGYERHFIKSIEGLPMEKRGRPGQKLVRLRMLGALNSVQTWNRPEGESPEVIATHLFSHLRNPAVKLT